MAFGKFPRLSKVTTVRGMPAGCSLLSVLQDAQETPGLQAFRKLVRRILDGFSGWLRFPERFVRLRRTQTYRSTTNSSAIFRSPVRLRPLPAARKVTESVFPEHFSVALVKRCNRAFSVWPSTIFIRKTKEENRGFHRRRRAYRISAGGPMRLTISELRKP